MEKRIPEFWVKTELDNLLLYVIGGDWGKDPTFNSSDYSLAYCIRGSEYRNWDKDKGSTASLRKIKKSNLEARKLRDGDILVEISGGGPEQPVGRTVLIDKTVMAFEPSIPKIHTNFLRLIRPSTLINSKFLNYYLLTYYSSGEVVKIQAGSNNLRNLKFPDYLKINIPLPPLSEQSRIVEKLDELFSELEKGKEQLQLALAQLKVYRQAVLKWAFEGRYFSKLSYPTVRLKDICYVNGGVTKGRNLERKKTVHVPYLRVANVQDGYLDLRVIKEIEVLPGDVEKYRLVFGDILYTEGGDRDKLGRGTIWRDEIENCIHQNHIFRARPKSSEVNPEYLSYYSQTKAAKDYFFQKGKHTTNLASINLTVLSELHIPFPEKTVQDKIVENIKLRFSICDNFEQTLTQVLQQSETLRQSLLQQAFEGKLVPQDPHDEPAAVLLERIQRERAEATKPAKSRKPLRSKNIHT